eukprot:symbB.v1.2.037925.t2/scaffold5741.1/size24060/2
MPSTSEEGDTASARLAAEDFRHLQEQLPAMNEIQTTDANAEAEMQISQLRRKLEQAEAKAKMAEESKAAAEKKLKTTEQELEAARSEANLLRAEVDALKSGGSSEADRAGAEKCSNILQTSFEGKLGAVRHFLKDPNAVKTTHEGYTSLHYAAQNGRDSVVQRLLAAGAAVEVAANDGYASLHYAAQHGRDSVVQRLLAAGAAVEAAANDGRGLGKGILEGGYTSLHYDDSVVQRLLAAGAVDSAANDGRGLEKGFFWLGRELVVEGLWNCALLTSKARGRCTWLPNTARKSWLRPHAVACGRIHRPRSSSSTAPHSHRRNRRNTSRLCSIQGQCAGARCFCCRRQRPDTAPHRSILRG